MDLVDLLILGLRLALVAVLYLFLALVVRAALRSLRSAAPAPKVAEPEGGALRLEVLEPGGTQLQAGQVVVVDAALTLGRAERAGLVLTDPAVSGEHARLARQAGAWVVTDLGSTNGTLLNQGLVDGQARLAPGDVLGLGNVRLKVVGA
jgi:pSer/pThr/pTyr-binding forkhead associated (FHA) protein